MCWMEAIRYISCCWHDFGMVRHSTALVSSGGPGLQAGLQNPVVGQNRRLTEREETKVNEKDLVTVSSSVAFRDVVMDMDRKGQEIYVRKHGSTSPVYEIIPRHADPFQKITLDSLFGSHWAPIYMEDFARALPSMPDPDIEIDIFTI